MFGKKDENNDMKLYTIRDSKAERCSPPFLSATHGEAERHFRKIANSPQSQVFATPEDFDLYFLGTFEEGTGSIKSLSTPQHIVKAIHCLNANVEQMRDQLLRDSVRTLNQPPKEMQQ